MKNLFLSFFIILLILSTTLIKSSTKKLEEKIYFSKENLGLLKEKYNLLKLEYDYLTSPNKLIEYQKLYFDGELKTLDIEKIGKIYIDQDGYKIEKFNFSKKWRLKKRELF